MSGDSHNRIHTTYFSTLVGQRSAMRLFRRACLMDEDGTAPAAIDMVTFWRLCAENILATNDESHGVATEPVPLGSISLLFTVAKEAVDLKGALERFTGAARLIRRECRVILINGRDTVRLKVTPAVENSQRAEIYVECFIVVVHCALRWMTGTRLDPLFVQRASSLIAMGDGPLAALHAPILRQGTGATIVYRSQDMSAPILNQKSGAWGDAEFASFVTMLNQEERKHEWQSRDAGSVIEALRSGLRSQAEVAQRLGISVATLRRRLSMAGLSFRRISAELREAELLHLLATNMSVQDVAERLGLSDDRSLRRFCHNRLGMSPVRYRNAGPT